MKWFLILFFPVLTQAQNVGVQVDNVKSDENTTIEIRKGEKGRLDREFEITEGTADIAGDPAALLKEARANWKKACEEWKKETKELNANNQILVLNCGSMTCSTVAMESTCTSKARYKIKVQIK